MEGDRLGVSTPGGIRDSGATPALWLQACRPGGGAREEEPAAPGKQGTVLLNAIHSPAFVLSALQPSPTRSSSNFQELPNQVTGGESWGGSEGHPCLALPAGPSPPARCPI